jgi:hypothetical protein
MPSKSSKARLRLAASPMWIQSFALNLQPKLKCSVNGTLTDFRWTITARELMFTFAG